MEFHVKQTHVRAYFTSIALVVIVFFAFVSIWLWLHCSLLTHICWQCGAHIATLLKRKIIAEEMLISTYVCASGFDANCLFWTFEMSKSSLHEKNVG